MIPNSINKYIYYFHNIIRCFIPTILYYNIIYFIAVSAKCVILTLDHWKYTINTKMWNK